MNPPAPANAPQHLWRDIEAAEAGVSAAVLADGDPVSMGGADVLVLLPPGATAGEGLAEAHARWHAAASDLVSFGPVDPVGGGAEPLELVRDLTRDFTDLAGGCHLAAAECSIGVRRELYEAAGGHEEAEGTLGRLDLLYRLHAAGAVFVAAPEARAAGPAGELAGLLAAAVSAGRTLELERPEAAAFVPLPPFRPVASPRRHERPALSVRLAIGEATPADEALASVERVLASRCGDFELRLQVPGAHSAHGMIAALAEGDGRVRLGETGPTLAPFIVTVPALAALDPRTLGDLHELALAEGAGALHVTVPGATPQEAMIDVVATAACSRAQRLAAATGETLEEIIGRLYGERWISGVEVSARRHGVDEPQVTEHGPLAAATDRGHERNAHLRFRDRAEDLAAKADGFALRTLQERLRARVERQAAERAESRLD